MNRARHDIHELAGASRQLREKMSALVDSTRAQTVSQMALPEACRACESLSWEVARSSSIKRGIATPTEKANWKNGVNASDLARSRLESS